MCFGCKHAQTDICARAPMSPCVRPGVHDSSMLQHPLDHTRIDRPRNAVALRDLCIIARPRAYARSDPAHLASRSLPPPVAETGNISLAEEGVKHFTSIFGAFARPQQCNGYCTLQGHTNCEASRNVCHSQFCQGKCMEGPM